MNTARLFWTLPAIIHTIVGKLTGGWRVVRHKDAQLIAADKYRWERWPYSAEHPGGQRPATWAAKPW